MKHIALATVCLILAACASTPLIVEGRFLQIGPADAAFSEIPFETRGTCEMVLKEMPYRQRKISRCAASSANLAYGFDSKPPLFEPLVISARTMEACEKAHAGSLKSEAKGNGKVLSECHKL
ncbi:hypothetical protein [Uliginosibacterium aquaticum]|uniref:Lipoprotein n=1 Tax=Uliginosibacterium aquaticum TaxID=2731212 RepID=A0ABX2IH95_9RHOO|nr:hypothetical protein [Uliginosibacterium aquaticum]NSL53460.1 hypothetical protein [Uliginosibacterium aquaticum]